MKKLITIICTTLVTSSYANVLPVFGSPDAVCNQKIVIPDAKKDKRLEHLSDVLDLIGQTPFEVDKDCKTIFIKPPKFGIMEVEKPSLTTKLKRCELVDGDYRILGLYQTQLEKAIQRGQSDKIEYYEAKYNEKLTTLSNMESIEGLTFKVHMYSQYEKIIEAFRIANTPEGSSSATIEVVALPLYGMYLSANLKAESAVDSLTRPVLLYSEIPGVNSTISSITSVLFEESFGNRLFDGSLSGIMRLSLSGSCAYSKQNSKEPDDYQNVNSFMAANVTYFYPVSTKTQYSLEIDTTAYVAMVKSLVEAGRSYVKEVDIINNTKQLVASGQINIKIDQGVSTERMSTEDQIKLKEDVAKSFAMYVLAHISETATTDENASKTYKISVKELEQNISAVATNFRQNFTQNSAYVKSGTFSFRRLKEPKTGGSNE